MKLMSDINVHLENRKASRIFFAFLWIMYSLVYTTKTCFSAALVFIKAEGILSLTQVSFILAMFYTVYAPLQVVGGIVADKYSPERMITVGLIGGAVANVIIFFNQSYWVMLVTWTLNAVVQFALWPSVFKILSSQLVRSDRPNMVFFISFAGAFGSVVASLVAALVGKNWRYNFAISAALLLILAVILQVFCRYLNPLLKKDRPDSERASAEERLPEDGLSTFQLFLVSGFFLLIAAIFLRTIVENSTKSFAATMLVDMYPTISGEIGSLLNALVLVGGIAGTVLVKKVLYPRIIKNEVVGFLVMLLLAFPFSLILCQIGSERIPVWVMVFSLTTVALLLSATFLLNQFFVMKFVKFGKNGTASGLMNAASSTAFALQYWIMGPVGEAFGWRVVCMIFAIISVCAILFVVLALRPTGLFRKHVNGED